jgi:hypothetical protein
MSTPTPRTDERAGFSNGLEVVPAAFARRLETELAACREALESVAYWSRSRTETRISLRDRIAAHLRDLRDLETPLDTSKL